MKTKLYRRRYKIGTKAIDVFYRRVTLQKQQFWECYSNGDKKWERCFDPLVQPGPRIFGGTIGPSSTLEFLLITGKAPESIKRKKPKKVEK